VDVGVVLVHGGGFAASCWELVLPLLETPAVAIDLPGRGSRPADLAEVTVEDFAEAVADDILSSGWDRVVLVGHSLAGITLPRVAALVPDRLVRLVFIAAKVPADGQSCAETLEPDVRARVGGGDGAEGGVTPRSAADREVAMSRLANDLDEGQLAFMLRCMVPEAPGPINAPVDLSGLAHPIGRTWVRCTRDAIIPVSEQQLGIDRLGGAGVVDVVDIDAGHMVMIGRPGELAGIIDSVAGRALS
jgi:pimeloyl-ACP methyl ester carboxylesterase